MIAISINIDQQLECKQKKFLGRYAISISIAQYLECKRKKFLGRYAINIFIGQYLECKLKNFLGRYAISIFVGQYLESKLKKNCSVDMHSIFTKLLRLKYNHQRSALLTIGKPMQSTTFPYYIAYLLQCFVWALLAKM